MSDKSEVFPLINNEKPYSMLKYAKINAVERWGSFKQMFLASNYYAFYVMNHINPKPRSCS